jgi:hypothetical protein
MAKLHAADGSDLRVERDCGWALRLGVLQQQLHQLVL